MEGCMHKKIQMPDGLKSTINLIVEQEWKTSIQIHISQKKKIGTHFLESGII
jgi:hypothetical protein